MKIDEVEMPNEVRSIFRLALELGTHAEKEAFEAGLRVVDTAPDRPTKMLAMLVLVAHMQASVKVYRNVLAEEWPALAPTLDRLLEAARG